MIAAIEKYYQISFRRMRKSIAFLFILTGAMIVKGQNTFKAVIKDSETKEPVIGATAVVRNTNKGASADIRGMVEIKNISNGKQLIDFRMVGYKILTDTFSFPLSLKEPILILLKTNGEELEDVVVSSTRSSRTIYDIPTRIESISGSDLDENKTMQPGNIKMLLTESTGIQTQQTSATSGSSSLRIQGLDGKYTQLLQDGFPIYAGFASGLSILQIPPLNLKRVEIIKGSASTLYGGGAIAGLINLITKEPGEKRELSFLGNVNQTGALDLSAFYGKKTGKFGFTLYAARNTQVAFDRNNDGFSDIPQYERYTFNPKIFYYINPSTTLSVGLNTAFENRMGGDMQVINGHADSIHSYFEKNNSNRYSSQLKFDKRFENKSILTLKNSAGYFYRNIDLPNYNFSGYQVSTYTELNYLLPKEKTEWITGINLWTDHFAQQGISLLPLNYNLITIGIFAQNNWKPFDRFVVETGLRTDYNSTNNVFVLPRISLMYKITNDLTSRIGGGLGYKPASIFSEEAETKSFRNIQPLDPNKTKAENSIGVNTDVNYRISLNDETSISVNQMFFYTQVQDPLLLSDYLLPNGNYEFYNANGTLVSKGFETRFKLRIDEFSAFVGYTFIDAQRNFNGASAVNPLTAKHRINTNIMYEIENKFRIVYEVFYVGSQYLSSGEKTRDYWVMGLSIEKKFKNFSLFINTENFLDSRQTRFEAMYTGTIQNPNFREIYSPVDGFILNGGVKISL